jgi:hypothetical protein
MGRVSTPDCPSGPHYLVPLLLPLATPARSRLDQPRIIHRQPLALGSLDLDRPIRSDRLPFGRTIFSGCR